MTIINIHESATLPPPRMLKLIMLTGSFNCLIQRKQLSCSEWHNNYTHNLTRGQWQVEEWHPHLHKVQRTCLHIWTQLTATKKMLKPYRQDERMKQKTILYPLLLFSHALINMICCYVLLFRIIHLLCHCTLRGNRNVIEEADLLCKIFISRPCTVWLVPVWVTGNHALCSRIWHDLETPRRRPSITIQATFQTPKIHLMCLKLLYNALGGFYMCWAHFICSYISQGEFSVVLMGAVHSEWVTCGDKWAHGSRPGSWIITHLWANSLFFHFYFLPMCRTFTMQWTPCGFGLIVYSHLL